MFRHTGSSAGQNANSNTQGEKEIYPPWGFREVFLIMGICLSANLVLKYSVQHFLFTDINPADYGYSLERFERAVAVSLFGQGMALYLTLFFLMAYFVKRRFGTCLARMGWTIHVSTNWVYAAFLVGMAWGSLYFFSTKWFLHDLPPGWKAIGFSTPQVKYAIFLQAMLVSIGIPVSEEFFFRGFVYPVFRKHSGVLFGILLSSLIFTVWHLQILKTPFISLPIMLGGVIKCIVYERSHLLIPPMIIHSVSNIVILVCSQCFS